jgi:hypothetical protein
MSEEMKQAIQLLHEGDAAWRTYCADDGDFRHGLIAKQLAHKLALAADALDRAGDSRVLSVVGALEQAITDLAAEFGSPVPEAVI